MVFGSCADEEEVDDLTKEFLAESREGLDRMERCLTELDQSPGNRELVAEIFRAVHTIKGATGFLGFGRLEALAHTGENLLGSVRAGKLAVTDELIGGLLGLLDGLRAVLRLIEMTGGEGQRRTDDDFELIGRLIELNGGGPALRACAGTALAQLVCEAVTPVNAPAGERERRPEPGDPCDTAAAAENEHAADMAERRVVTQPAEKTVRVDVNVLNRMMNLVGELVLTRNGFLQCGAETADLSQLSRRLDWLTSELRETVMQARMQPVGQLFGKFPRMVRDLAQVCGRKVRLELDGERTGMDKNLLEAVRDPLTHAVRNAVDHGIEPPEVRIAAGKNSEGLIRLRAYHKKGRVAIEISDDGAGISPERVRAKAVERGLITAEHAARMPDREALDLVFAPGFSTTSQVTSVSGRGVGMDVVRSNVERVGGSLELESHVGFGTTLRLNVPLTMVIVPALVVRSGGQSFALPQRALLELVYVPERELRTAIERIGDAEVYRLREQLLPLLRLDVLLGVETAAEREPHGVTIAVVEMDGCRYALAIEEILAPQELVLKPLSAALRQIGLFVGTAVLGNESLALILDLAGIAAKAGVRPKERASWAEAQLASREAHRSLREERPMVVYEVAREMQWGREVERGAISIQSVERIETVARDCIEYAGGRPILHRRGELLSVEDDGGLLRRAEPAELTLLIRTGTEADGDRRIASVVERVLDVCGSEVPAEHGPTQEGYVAVVNDWVTVVHGQIDGLPSERLREEVA